MNFVTKTEDVTSILRLEAFLSILLFYPLMSFAYLLFNSSIFSGLVKSIVHSTSPILPSDVTFISIFGFPFSTFPLIFVFELVVLTVICSPSHGMFTAVDLT